MSKVYVVVDDLQDWPEETAAPFILGFDTYLAEHPRKGEKKTRIINLCSPGGYLSRGYYCSLLAEARGHRVLPTVNTLNDLRSQELTLIRLGDLLTRRGKTAAPASGEGRIAFKAYFGHTESPELRALARRL
ncbi:MAG: RimK-like ATPgrasp N-terminal domain-containing protein, partial [Oceanococcaceae bacterium]